jgi:hypothetical protein
MWMKQSSRLEQMQENKNSMQPQRSARAISHFEKCVNKPQTNFRFSHAKRSKYCIWTEGTSSKNVNSGLKLSVTQAITSFSSTGLVWSKLISRKTHQNRR